MAYDPALTSFILTGVVGAVAVVMGVASHWEASDELARATDRWTAPWLSRTYGDDEAERKRLSMEGAILRAHGYVVASRRPGDEASRRESASPEVVSAGVAAGALPGRTVVTYQLV